MTIKLPSILGPVIRKISQEMESYEKVNKEMVQPKKVAYGDSNIRDIFQYDGGARGVDDINDRSWPGITGVIYNSNDII